MRARLTGVMLPLVLLAAAGGHTAGDAVARAPSHHIELFSTQDSSKAFLLMLAFLVFAAAVVGAVASAEDALRNVAPLPFAFLPPLIFTVGEVAEAVVSHQSVGQSLLAPAFAAGFVAQVPFALGAYLLARLLCRLGAALWHAIVAEHRPCALLGAPTLSWYDAYDRASFPVVAGVLRDRGPPLARVSAA